MKYSISHLPLSFPSVWTQDFFFIQWVTILYYHYLFWWSNFWSQIWTVAAPTNWLLCPCVMSSFKQFLTFKAIKCSNLISYLSYPSSVHQPFLKGRALVLFSGESYLELVPVLLSATGIWLQTVLFWKENKVKWKWN